MKSISFFLELLEDHAKTRINKEQRGDLIAELYEASNRGRQAYQKVKNHNYFFNIHVQLTNRHNSPYDRGCGCIYCAKRHDYVKLKLKLHKMKKSYEIFWEYRSSVEKSLQDHYEKEKVKLLEEIKEARRELKEIKRALELLGKTVIL